MRGGVDQRFIKIEDDCPFLVGVFCLRVLEFCILGSCGWTADGGGREAPGNATQKATMELQDSHERVVFLLVFVELWIFWGFLDDSFRYH